MFNSNYICYFKINIQNFYTSYAKKKYKIMNLLNLNLILKYTSKIKTIRKKIFF
jgi:hypothetical protein